MEKQFDYKVLHDLELTIECYEGSIDLDNLIKFKRIEIKDPAYNPDHNIIHDFRDSELLFTVDDIKKFIQYVKETPRVGGERRSAFLTSSPNNVVVTTLYEIKAEELPMIFMVFSTLEAAAIWLGYFGNEILVIEESINQMKNNLS